MMYNLYHVHCDTDKAALAEQQTLAGEVHAAGGALWTSLSHGQGQAVVVVALPVAEEGPLVDKLGLGVGAVAAVSRGMFEEIDPDFVPLYPDEEETPTDDEPTPVAG